MTLPEKSTSSMEYVLGPALGGHRSRCQIWDQFSDKARISKSSRVSKSKTTPPVVSGGPSGLLSAQSYCSILNRRVTLGGGVELEK